MSVGNNIVGIVFSKDRGMQLDAVLRSFYRHCRDIQTIDIQVLYTTSTPVHQRQYNTLI